MPKKKEKEKDRKFEPDDDAERFIAKKETPEEQGC